MFGSNFSGNRLPEERVFNNIVFRLAATFHSYNAAATEAYFQRKRGYYSRVVEYEDKVGVYIARKY